MWHDASLALAGIWARSGVPLEDAERGITIISTLLQDEEPEDRLKAVQDTYERWEKKDPENYPVAGKEKFTEVHSEDRMKWIIKLFSNFVPVLDNPTGGNRPVVRLGGPLHTTVEAILDCLAEHHKAQPRLFLRQGDPVTLRRDEVGEVKFIEVTFPILRQMISEAVQLEKWNTDLNRYVALDIPPKDYVDQVLAHVTTMSKKSRFPGLLGIITAPTLRPDGTVLDIDGYDEGTRLFLDGDDAFTTIRIPDKPTRTDVKNAVTMLNEVLSGFVFVEDGSKANAFAALMTPILVPSFTEPTPMFLFDKPTPGSGASFLAQVIGLLATGYLTPMTAAPNNLDDWRKTITSILDSGQRVVCWDNIDRPIGNAYLAALLTAPTWNDRKLGETKQISLPNRTVWIATGNNIQPTKDLQRRTVSLRMDPGMEHPEERKPTDFPIPDLLGHIRENRPELVTSILTLARAWVSEGRPEAPSPILSGYDQWCTTLGGILYVSGVSGFLQNIQANRAVDEESLSWGAFLTAIQNWRGTEPFLAADLATPILEERKIQKDTGISGPFLMSLPVELVKALERSESLPIKLGQVLNAKKERIFQGRRLVQQGHNRNKIRLWTVEEVGNIIQFPGPRDPNPDPDGDGGGSGNPDHKTPFFDDGQKCMSIGGEGRQDIGTDAVLDGNEVVPNVSDGVKVQATSDVEKRGYGGSRGLDLPTLYKKPENIKNDLIRDLYTYRLSQTTADPLPPQTLKPPQNGTGKEDPDVVFNEGEHVNLKSEVVVISSPTELVDAFHHLNSGTLVSLDTETTGLDPHSDKLRVLTLGNKEKVYVLDTWKFPGWEQVIGSLFMDPNKVIIGHNVSFDIQFLWSSLPGFDLDCHWWDTMIASQVYEGGRYSKVKGYHTLKNLSKKYLKVDLDKEHQVSDWSKETLSPEQLHYAGMDVAVLLPLYELFTRVLNHPSVNLGPITKIEMDCIPAVAQMEYVGMPFNRQGWESLSVQALEQGSTLREEVTKILGNININSHVQLKKAIFDLTGIALVSTDADHLTEVKDKHPVFDLLLRYKDFAKKSSTYGTDFIKEHVNPITGRVHTHYRQLGADSGRFSSNSPNIQQIPRDKAYRACFSAPQGRALVKTDYSQIELRIAAVLSGDETMLNAYRTGEDLHKLTASLVTGLPLDQVKKEHRQLAKSVNFGFLYGMGSENFKTYAKSNYGVTLTDAEATQFRNRFFQSYKTLRVWHTQCQFNGQNPESGEPITEGPKDVRTMGGRVRRGVTAYTQKINTPVQGTGADGLKKALGSIWYDRHNAPGDMSLVATIHDEIVVECDRHYATEVAQWVKGHMERAMDEIVQSQIPIEAEATIALDWSGTTLPPEPVMVYDPDLEDWIEDQEATAKAMEEWRNKNQK